MAILPESGHAKFLKLLDVSNTNQTMLIIIIIPNKSAGRNLSWKPQLLHCLKQLSLNSPKILQNGNFAWVQSCENFSNFLMSQILTKPSLFSSEYQVRVPDEIWPEKLHFYLA